MLTGHSYNHSRPIPDKNKDKYIKHTTPLEHYWRRWVGGIWLFEIFAK